MAASLPDPGPAPAAALPSIDALKRGVAALALALLATSTCSASPVAENLPSYAGWPLAEALRDLEARGLRLIFSDNLVRPEMQVEGAAAADSPRQLVTEMLRPHGLALVDGPDGRLLVVPAPAARSPLRGEPPTEAERPAELVVSEEIVVTPSRWTLLEARPESHRFLDRHELDRLPHLADDLFRAIAWLPGAAVDDVSPELRIRGGAGDEVLILLDGAEIYEPYHLKPFNSVFSTVDTEAVGGVEYLTASFPAEYGNRMGGVLDVTTLEPTGRRATLGLGLVHARALGAGTFAGRRGDWLATGRRGFMDLLLELVELDELSPAYHDLLAKVRYRPNERTSVAGHLLAADDRLELDDAAERLDGRDESAYGWITAGTVISPHVHARTLLSLARGEARRQGGFDDGGGAAEVDDRRSFEVAVLKQDWHHDEGGRHALRWGFEAQRAEARFRYRRRSEVRGPLVPGGAPRLSVLDLEAAPRGELYGLYLADRIRTPGRRLTFDLGLRWDRQSHAPGPDQWSPRLQVHCSLGRHSVVRGAWGRFHQPQRVHELQIEDGETFFHRAQRAEHLVLGFEHQVPERGLFFRLELYDKRFDHPRPRYENLYDPLRPFREAEADRARVAPSEARARGLEIVLQRRRSSGWSWQVGYALSSAEDRLDGRDVPRLWDETHALTFGASWHRGPMSLALGGTVHSGWPVTGASTEPAGDGSTDIVFGPRNGERYPTFERLDLRLRRTFRLRRGELSIFLEVHNLLGHRNFYRVEGYQLTPRADGSMGILTERGYGLPRVPSFGVAWDF